MASEEHIFNFIKSHRADTSIFLLWVLQAQSFIRLVNKSSAVWFCAHCEVCGGLNKLGLTNFDESGSN